MPEVYSNPLLSSHVDTSDSSDSDSDVSSSYNSSTYLAYSRNASKKNSFLTYKVAAAGLGALIVLVSVIIVLSSGSSSDSDEINNKTIQNNANAPKTNIFRGAVPALNDKELIVNDDEESDRVEYTDVDDSIDELDKPSNLFCCNSCSRCCDRCCICFCSYFGLVSLISAIEGIVFCASGAPGLDFVTIKDVYKDDPSCCGWKVSVILESFGMNPKKKAAKKTEGEGAEEGEGSEGEGSGAGKKPKNPVEQFDKFEQFDNILQKPEVAKFLGDDENRSIKDLLTGNALDMFGQFKDMLPKGLEGLNKESVEEFAKNVPDTIKIKDVKEKGLAENLIDVAVENPEAVKNIMETAGMDSEKIDLVTKALKAFEKPKPMSCSAAWVNCGAAFILNFLSCNTFALWHAGACCCAPDCWHCCNCCKFLDIGFRGGLRATEIFLCGEAADAEDGKKTGEGEGEEYCDFRNYRQQVQLIYFIIFVRIPHFKMDFLRRFN